LGLEKAVYREAVGATLDQKVIRAINRTEQNRKSIEVYSRYLEGWRGENKEKTFSAFSLYFFNFLFFCLSGSSMTRELLAVSIGSSPPISPLPD